MSNSFVACNQLAMCTTLLQWPPVASSGRGAEVLRGAAESSHPQVDLGLDTGGWWTCGRSKHCTASNLGISQNLTAD